MTPGEGVAGVEHALMEEASIVVHDGHRVALCDCLLQLQTTLGGRTIKVIVDSGATLNLLLKEHVDHTVTCRKITPIAVMTASRELQYLNEKVAIVLEFQGYPYVFDFYLTSALLADALIGVQGMNQAGWVVNVPLKTIHHLTHALPPLKCSPCKHTVTLVYAATDTVIPARTWVRVPVTRPKDCGAPMSHVAVLTPTTPLTLALHGAPTVVTDNKASQYALICNTSNLDITIPAQRPVAYWEEGDVMSHHHAFVLAETTVL